MATPITEKEKEGMIDVYKTGKYNTAEIAEITKRSVTAVQKVIDAFVANNPDEKQEKETNPDAGKQFVSKQIIDDAIYHLYKTGVQRDNAETVINSVIPLLKERVTSTNDFIKFVISMADIHLLGSRSTMSGRGGVFVMTEALSQSSDNSVKGFKDSPDIMRG